MISVYIRVQFSQVSVSDVGTQPCTRQVTRARDTQDQASEISRARFASASIRPSAARRRDRTISLALPPPPPPAGRVNPAWRLPRRRRRRRRGCCAWSSWRSTAAWEYLCLARRLRARAAPPTSSASASPSSATTPRAPASAQNVIALCPPLTLADPRGPGGFLQGWSPPPRSPAAQPFLIPPIR